MLGNLGGHAHGERGHGIYEEAFVKSMGTISGLPGIYSASSGEGVPVNDSGRSHSPGRRLRASHAPRDAAFCPLIDLTFWVPWVVRLAGCHL